MGTMSYDRIKFYLPAKYNVVGMDEALRKAFDISASEVSRLWNAGRVRGKSGCSGIHITCRPSQFARFLVYRAEAIDKYYGSASLVNGFRDLNVELFTPEEECAPTNEVDASKRPHNGGRH